MPNIIEEMTAFAEIQVLGSFFQAIVKAACSAAPNPFPTFPFLQGRLIQRVDWAGSGDTILQPPNFTAPPGQVALMFPVKITSIALNDFIQSPQSQGTTDDVHYIVTVSVAGQALVAALVRVDHGPGQSTHYVLPAPVPLAQQSFQKQLGNSIPVKGGAVLFQPDDVVVVVRLATTDLARDMLILTPIVTRVFSDTALQKVWAVFLSGGTLASIFSGQLNAQLEANLPSDPSNPKYSGVVVVAPPTVDWARGGPDDTFGITATVPLDARQKCPTVLGHTDIHVTLNVRIDFIAEVQLQNFLLWAHISHDTSAWDVFFCTLINVLVGGLIPGLGIVGFFPDDNLIGFAALTLLPGILFSTVTQQVAQQNFKPFVKTDPPFGGDDVTLTGSQPMPTLYPNNVIPSGEAIEATLAGDGVTVRGSWALLKFPLPATHAMQLIGDPIGSEWPAPEFDCQTNQMEIGPLEISAAVIRDNVTLVPAIGAQPAIVVPGQVELFQVVAIDSAAWKPEGTLNQLALFQGFKAVPVGDPATLAGLTGKVYAHSSVGLASATILPLPVKPVPAQPTGVALIKAIEDCRNFKASAPQWPGGGSFDLRWLVDPAPWEAAAGVMHEWAVRINAFAADTTAELTIASAAGSASASFAGTQQVMTAHLVTGAGDRLRLNVHGRTALGGIVAQRLLVIADRFHLAAPIRALAHGEDGFFVLTATELVTMSLDRGVLSAWDSRGATHLARADAATYVLAPSGTFRLTLAGLQPVPTARVRPASTQVLGSTFLRLDAQHVLVADGADLVVTRPGRFRLGGPTRSA